MSVERPGLWRNLGVRWRGGLTRRRLALCGARAGTGLGCGPGVRIVLHPGARLDIGRNVFLGPYTTLEVRPAGVLRIGDGVKFTGHTQVVAAEHVEFGAHSLVAEFCSVRDHEHGTLRGRRIGEQPLVSAPVRIGEDVWLGRGACVLRGTTLGDGAVLGANAVLKGEVAAHAIFAGVPARQVGERRPPPADTGAR